MSAALQGYLAELIGPWAGRWLVTPANPAGTLVKLAQHGWQSIDHPQGMQIKCLQGTALITQEGDPSDQLLVAGETFTVTRPEHLYVQATQACELRFTKPGTAEAVRAHSAPQHWQPGVES
jgi:Protein of unknown function (DUF2917)